jgi:hypothetical protein
LGIHGSVFLSSIRLKRRVAIRLGMRRALFPHL